MRRSSSSHAKRTHDYVRQGITNLFAALNVATGAPVGASWVNQIENWFWHH
jgi:hypothetical protein